LQLKGSLNNSLAAITIEILEIVAGAEALKG
jgi:F0F1-type ATP synthase gamma subunit